MHPCATVLTDSRPKLRTGTAVRREIKVLRGMGTALLAPLCALLPVARPAHAAESGDWRDESRTRGFLPCNGSTRQIFPAKNVAYCDRHTIPRDSAVEEYSPIINKAFKDLRARDSAGGTPGVEDI